ncbi:alpha/beta hydrolase [Pseudonocardia sp. NPDC049635]|uniref:alpha/beta fold hydrolase n=1 Tax=Pseudonocardia sp. NPDC049635 TaxID=3155506 RepID=UPI003408BC48
MTRRSVLHLRDRNIGFDDTGGSGTPILLAHGFALDRTMFAGQEDLAPRYRVITWDAPGHGDSPVGTAAFSFWELAQIQLALMDALDIRSAVVGGVSQGGFIALRTALLAPDRVTALLLFDTEAGSLDEHDSRVYDELFAAIERVGTTPEIATALASQVIGEHPTARLWERTWAERGIPLGPPVDCLTQRDDVTDRLAEIGAPALVVAGEHDHSIPIERQNQMRTRLPRATEMNVVSGAGHSPPLTHPLQVNALINNFLATAL